MTTDSAKSPLGCFRFSLLNLLLLTTVVGLLVANWHQRRTNQEQMSSLLARAKEAERYIIRQRYELTQTKREICQMASDRAERLLERGEHEEAILGFHETFELQKRLLAFSHSVGTARQLVDLHFRSGDLQAAEPYLEQLIKWRRSRASQGKLPETLTQLGLVRMDQQRYAEAEQLFQEALERRRDRPNWMVYELTSLVGETAARQGRYAEAEAMLLEGYQGLRDRQAEIPEDQREIQLMRAANFLALLYEQWGKEELIGTWRRLAESAPLALEPESP